MENSSGEKITLYTSTWCVHALTVEGFLKRNSISVNRIVIDGDDEARQELININGGYASVPTLVFPDGTKLTEPSLGQLRQKLGLKSSPGLTARLRSFLGRSSENVSN